MRSGIALAISITALAAEVRVTVSDPSGKAVQAAAVSAQCKVGRAQTLRTDAAGIARFANIPPGSCRFEVRHPGFENWAATLSVENGKEASLDAALQLARRTESVAVKESLAKRFKNWLTSCTRR